MKNMGLDVDNIDPRKIRLYGNGGGQLPFANSAPRCDDLQENSILGHWRNRMEFLMKATISYFMEVDQTQWKLDPATVNSATH